MKHLVLGLLVLAGCAKDPLKQDLEMFCAMDVSGKRATEWGPKLEASAKSPELQSPLAMLKAGSISVPEFLKFIETLNRKAGITTCPAFATLNAPK